MPFLGTTTVQLAPLEKSCEHDFLYRAVPWLNCYSTSGMTFDRLFQDIFLIIIPLYNIIIRFLLHLVRKRCERRVFPVFPLQRAFQKIVAHMRVLRKERTMQICCDHVFIDNALISRFPGISETVRSLFRKARAPRSPCGRRGSQIRPPDGQTADSPGPISLIRRSGSQSVVIFSTPSPSMVFLSVL